MAALIRKASSSLSMEFSALRAKYWRIIVVENSPASNFQISYLALNPDIIVILGAGENCTTAFEISREKYKFSGIINENLVLANVPVTNTTPRISKSADKKIISGVLHVGNFIFMLVNVGTDSIENAKKFFDENVTGKTIDVLILKSRINFHINGFVSEISESTSPYIHISEKNAALVKNAFANLSIGFPRCIDMCQWVPN